MALLAADQGSKVLVRTHMALGESINVIGDFFRLTYIENNGAAFSMMSGQRLFLVFFPVIAGIGAIWYLCRHRNEHWSLYLSWAVILAGGAGNFIDRAVRGSVTDMLDFSIFPPIFNVADICVCVGCGALALYVFVGERWKKA